MPPKRPISFQEQELARALHEHQPEIAEFSDLFEEVFPEFHTQFESWWKEPLYIKLIGDDRVCTICGALIHAGGRYHHSAWHKKLTVAIWLLQGGYLAHMVGTGRIKISEGIPALSEDTPEPKTPPKKPKLKKLAEKKRKKKRKKEKQ